VSGDQQGAIPGWGAFPPVDPALTAPPPGLPATPPPAWPAAPDPRSSYGGLELNPYAAPGTNPWGAPAPPARKWRRRSVALVWVTVVLLVVVPTAVVTTWLRDRAQQHEQQMAAVTSVIESHLPTLEAFVAQRTGRPWKSSVRARILDDADFVAALRNVGGGIPYEPSTDDDDMGVTMTAMGLVDDPETFWGSSDESIDANVVGVYDAENGQLLVRGSTYSPQVEITLVHELVHANQDQAFDLHKLWAATTTVDESPLALQSLSEGEATVVEEDYYDAQPADWQKQVDDADGGAVSSGVPVVDTMGGFPYRVGAAFVRGLRDAGGTAAVTKAWGSPPRWSRDLVDPKGWAAGTLPKVTLPPQPKSPSSDTADTADIGVLGVGGLWLAVEGAQEHPSLKAIHALDGWTGDSYVATENADATRWCFVDDVTFTDAASREKAFAFLKPWLVHTQTRATDTGTSGMHLTGCTG
jgi:hypothetical protein